jgi:hypothetical protein
LPAPWRRLQRRGARDAIEQFAVLGIFHQALFPARLQFDVLGRDRPAFHRRFDGKVSVFFARGFDLVFERFVFRRHFVRAQIGFDRFEFGLMGVHRRHVFGVRQILRPQRRKFDSPVRSCAPGALLNSCSVLMVFIF